MPLLLAMMTVSGQRLPGDTGVIWIKKADALRVLARADSLPGYKQLVSEKQKDIDTINARINVLQGVIRNLTEKDSASVQLFKDQLAVMREQKALYQNQLDGYEKILRKERRRRRWTAILGTVTTGVVTYLYITK